MILPNFGRDSSPDGIRRVAELAEELERGLALLRDKYAQYRDEPPGPPVLAVDVIDVRVWSAIE